MIFTQSVVNEELTIWSFLSVTLNDGVMPRSEIEGKDNSSEDKSNYKVVCKGDMVYNSMRMWQGANGVSDYDGIVSPAYTVLMPNKEIDNRYFASLFKTPNLINEFRKYSQGLTSDTWNLKYPQIRSIRLYIPSLQEQHKISVFISTLEERIGIQRQLVDSPRSIKEVSLPTSFPANVTSLLLKPHGQRRHLLICVVSSEAGETYQHHSLPKLESMLCMVEMVYEGIVTIIVMKVNML